MATVPLVQYEDAPREVKDIFDDIRRTRNVDEVNNFWKALAKSAALDEVTKEMIYRAHDQCARERVQDSGRRAL